MAGDPTRDVLVEALRRFRRASGDFDRERVAADDTLQEWVGEGDVDQTWNIIMRLVEQSAIDPDGDVFAFFISCGWKTSGDTLDTRLKRYAAKFHVDERTALRRSDRGAKKLAKMLRDALTHDRPLAQFFVFQDGPILIPWLTVHAREDSHWRRPRVYVNDQRVENLAFEVKGPGTFADFSMAQERIADVPLDPTVGGYDPMASVRVQWAMPIWPSWDLSVHLADNRLVSRLTVEKDGVAEVRVSWFGDDAAATRDTPLAAAPTYTEPASGAEDPAAEPRDHTRPH